MVRQFCNILLLVLFILANIRSVFSTPGPNSLFHMKPAWNLLKGNLYLRVHSRTFQTNEIIRTEKSPKHAVPFRNLHSGFTAGYGLTPHFEVGLSQILYQDHHQGGSGYNLPDDLILSVKYSTARFSNSFFHFGSEVSTRLPLAKKHNVVLEPFSSSKPAFKIMGLVSFAPNHYMPENIFSMHLNLGYIFHANSGEIITNSQNESLAVAASTQELMYGFAMFLPLKSLKLSLEFSGNKYIKRPPPTANAGRNYRYFTPGLHFPVSQNIRLSLGADFRMSADYPLKYDEDRPEENQIVTFHLASYPKWRIQAGIHFQLTVRKPAEKPDIISTPIHPDSVETDSIETARKQQEKLEKLAPEAYREMKRIESSKENLKKIKEERLERDRELEALRKKLQERQDEAERKRRQKEKSSGNNTEPEPPMPFF